MSTTSIDDLLLGGKTSTKPETPEHQDIQEPEAIEEYEGQEASDTETQNDDYKTQDDLEANSEEHEEQVARHVDDYGNESDPKNEAIRERLARQARKYESEIEALRSQLQEQGAPREVQNAARDFEYDPDSKADWQQQLASFVKQTVNSMTREQQESQERQVEAKAQREFEDKFVRSMSKFEDFRDVMTNLSFEITNPMTLATRAMDDPAAFLYAAAKRQPKELERISKIRDPYVQMTEMGRLEERMRKNKTTTNAPRPLGRTLDDATSREPKKNKEPSVEDLIARADAKRIAKMKASRGTRR